MAGETVHIRGADWLRHHWFSHLLTEYRRAWQGMGREPGKVSWLPPTLAQWFIPEPGDHPDHIHGGGIQQLLEMRACQPQVPTLTEVKAPGALREATLDPCPQSVLDFKVYRLLPLACRLDGLMVRLRSDGELPWSAFRRGARRTGGTRATGGSVKPDANDRIIGQDHSGQAGPYLDRMQTQADIDRVLLGLFEAVDAPA